MLTDNRVKFYKQVHLIHITELSIGHENGTFSWLILRER